MQAQSYVQNENWSTFNELARTSLAYESLPKDQLNQAFLQIERLIFEGINYLLHTTTFVEDNLCYLLGEIASGVIKSRKVYKGKRIRRRVTLNDDIEMGSENRRIFGIGFDLFKLSRMDRKHAVPYIKRIIRILRVSTSTYENILSAFAREGDRYCAVSDELARTTIELVNQKRRNAGRPSKKGAEREAHLTQQVELLIEQLDLLELNIGCVEPNFLYGTVRSVKRIMRRVRKLQEQILKAYLRLVIKPVKNRAETEGQALDLFQSGSLGLSRAISLYDLRQGTSFPTFANQWIRQKILGYGKHSGSLIKLPGSVIERFMEIRKAERHFESDAELRDSYTDADVAQRCNLSVKSVQLVKKKVHSTRVVPLESMVYNSDDGSEVELAADRALLDESVDEEEELQATREFVEQVLDHVDEQQRNLVCLRYGVIDSVVTKITPAEQLREVFRQAACKSILQQSMAVSVDSRLLLARVEELPKD